MLRIKNTAAPSGAHNGPGSGFAFQRGPLLAPENDGAGGGGGSGGNAGGGGRTFTQEEVDRIAANARREGQERRGTSSSNEEMISRAVEAGIARGLQAMSGAAATPGGDAPRAPAAAPSNSQPSASQSITSDGLTNIYNMSPEQFAATSAPELRRLHEQNVAAAQRRSGAPSIPVPPRSK